MITYVLEIVMFQLAFLLVYDLFLKRETFFQWNRAYLLITYVVSLVLPWIKIEAFSTTLPTEYAVYPTAFYEWYTPEVDLVVDEARFWSSLTWYEWAFGIGILIASLLFIIKLLKIDSLKRRGQKQYYPQFTKVIIAQSELAFSFFRHVFMGDHISKEKEESILAHELVHIRQYHSFDLLFFELMRIVFWFNPLTYVYQSRMAELHEFIADAQVAKTDKKEQYQMLLSEVFETQHISFINQFFKKSLIKKRIVMLSKSKSKKVFQLKYLLLLPVVLGMLVYTSCEQEVNAIEEVQNGEISASDVALIAKIEAEYEIIKDSQAFFQEHAKLSDKVNRVNEISSKEEFFTNLIYTRNSMLALKIQNGLESDEREFLSTFPIPSTALYHNYIDRKKAFQLLDTDVMTLTSNYQYNIRKVVKKDKNLGPGEFMTVGNVTDFTEEEINRLNGYLGTVANKKRIVFVSDDTHGFLITNVVAKKDINGYPGLINVSVQDKPVPFAVVDEVPIFPGCENATDKRACFQEGIQQHIKKHFNYPLEAQEQGVQGRVNVVFQITKGGLVANIRKRGPHELLENEVERIIKRLPKMEPGRQDGTSVSVPFSIPVNFVLANGRDSNLKKQ